jgi:plastocyanin
MRIFISILALIFLFGAAALFLGHRSPSPATTSSAQTVQATVAPNTIAISNYLFGPDTITVKQGTLITWKNEDIARHTITADQPSDSAPSSMLIGKGESYSFTFTKPGTYTYHCEPHPYMKATIIVTQ